MGLDDCVLRTEIGNSESLNLLTRSRSWIIVWSQILFRPSCFPIRVLNCHPLIERDNSAKKRHIHKCKCDTSKIITLCFPVSFPKPYQHSNHSRLLQDCDLLYQLVKFSKEIVFAKSRLFHLSVTCLLSKKSQLTYSSIWLAWLLSADNH